MKKLLLTSLTLALLISGIGCTAAAMEEETTQPLEQEQLELIEESPASEIEKVGDLPEIIECYAGYGYTGVIAEVVNVGDNPDTEFVEGSLVIEVADDNLGAIIVYLTDAMSTESIENYAVGDSVQFMMDYELNFDGAKDLPHVSPFTLFKVENK